MIAAGKYRSSDINGVDLSAGLVLGVYRDQNNITPLQFAMTPPARCFFRAPRRSILRGWCRVESTGRDALPLNAVRDGNRPAERE